MAYIGRQQDGFGVRSRFIYTATGGQTTFDTDDSSNALSYSDGAYVDVYLNGVLLDPSDYTATSLTSIVLDAGAAADDVLEVIVYDVFSVFSGTFTNGITASEATITNGISAGSATVTGDLTVDTNTLFVDASADAVGIGTSSPSSKTSIIGTSVNGLHLGQQTDNTANSSRLFYDNSTNIWTTYSTAGSFKIASGATIGTSSGTDRLVIDSSGNVGIGTSSPSAPLEISTSSGDALKVTTSTGRADLWLTDTDTTAGQVRLRGDANNLVFITNTTEQMRIDSSGNVGIGTSSPSSYYSDNLVVKCDASEGGITIASNATTDTNYLMFADGTSGDALYRGYIGYTHNSPENMQVVSSGYTRFYTGDPRIERMRIASGGQLFLFHQTSGAGNATLKYTTGTGAVTYDTSSRLVKENIVDCPYGLAEIVQLQPRKYFRIDDQANEVGLIADEVQSIMPEFVPTGEKSLITGVEEDTEIIALGVNYDKMVAPLVQAIKELNTKIETLEAKVTALENA